MKLRTKLLLGIGILLFAMVIVIYIVPTLFIRRDLRIASGEIRKLLIEEQEQLLRSQQLWLENILVYTKQNNDALLLMYYDEPERFSSLLFTEKNTDYDVWMGLARFSGYTPTIGFLQAHAPEKKRAAVIMPHATTLYQASALFQESGKIFISILDPKEAATEIGYRGIALPDALQTENEHTFYALIAPEKSKEEVAIIQEEIAKMPLKLVERALAASEQLSGSNLQKTAYGSLWATKINMIRVLTPFFAEGVSLNQDAYIPEGLARIDHSGKGYTILTKEIFSTEPLFDDALYYKLHLPKDDSPPLANGSVIVTDNLGDHAYIGNTLFRNGTYLTVGTSLTLLAQELALSSNKIILLNVKNDFWLGYDGSGKRIAQRKLDEMIKSGITHQKSGVVNIAGDSFFYGEIASLENGALTFYDFHPLGGEKSIVNTLFSLEKRLSHQISLQLFLISIGTMALVLLFIGRVGFTAISPITKLAGATEFVVAGRYGEVVLPDVGNRKDEVAILTRSFADMVVGLQERERIRGVLDKVVSKDVADEILRTQIHLGGEDRVATVLFSDIRGFSHLSSQFSPQKTIGMLNACMTKVSRVIEGEGGVIDKYIGDAVMAIYGAPTSNLDHALRAVSSGMLIIETLKVWNLGRLAAKEPLIEMGIGVHTGIVVAGNMGSEDRLNYTVLGSNVNLTERLCESAGPNQLIISAATLAEPNVAASFYVKALPPLKPKGFTEPIEIYEVTGFKWEES